MRVQVDRPKGLNSQDLFPLGIKTEKKNPQSLTLCQGQTNGRAELNSENLFLWGSKGIHNWSEPSKII